MTQFQILGLSLYQPPLLPDRHIQEEILEVMVHHEGVIIEDGSIGDIGDSDQVPDNVLEHVMRSPHLD